MLAERVLSLSRIMPGVVPLDVIGRRMPSRGRGLISAHEEPFEGCLVMQLISHRLCCSFSEPCAATCREVEVLEGMTKWPVDELYGWEMLHAGSICRLGCRSAEYDQISTSVWEQASIYAYKAYTSNTAHASSSALSYLQVCMTGRSE